MDTHSTFTLGSNSTSLDNTTWAESPSKHLRKFLNAQVQTVSYLYSSFHVSEWTQAHKPFRILSYVRISNTKYLIDIFNKNNISQKYNLSDIRMENSVRRNVVAWPNYKYLTRIAGRLSIRLRSRMDCAGRSSGHPSWNKLVPNWEIAYILIRHIVYMNRIYTFHHNEVFSKAAHTYTTYIQWLVVH